MTTHNSSTAPEPTSDTDIRCADCGSPKVQTTIEREPLQYGYGEEAVTLDVLLPVRTCQECGHQYTDDAADKLRHQAVCRHLGVLAPDEIRRTRERLGMSPEQFAGLTRISQSLLERWEEGASIQSGDSDQLLYLLSFPENAERLQRRRAESMAKKDAPEAAEGSVRVAPRAEGPATTPAIGPEEIARWLDGEIDDPAESVRIAQAVAGDPQAQRWFELLDIERLEPPEPEADEVPQDVSLARARTGDLLGRLRRSVLWPLQPETGLHRLIDGTESSETGTLVTPEGRIPFSVERVNVRAGLFQLTVSGWPVACDLPSIVLARLDILQREPAVKPFLPRGRQVRMAARTSDPGGGPGRRRVEEFASRDFRGRFDPRTLKLDVCGAVPNGESEDLVVAELAYETSDGRTERQVQPVRLIRTPGDLAPPDWRLGFNQFRLPTAYAGGQMELTVRSLADDDLYLLTPDQVADVLARAREIIALPIERGEDSLTFECRWPEQRRLAADPSIRWFLQAVRASEDA